LKAWNNSTNSFKAIIIGKLLGDGSITKQNRRKPRFQFTHVFPDYAWSQYCYENLVEFIPVNPPKYKKTIDRRLKRGYSESFYVQSKTDSIITFLRSVWYVDGTKVIPFQLIQNYFNEQTLAWWYMDDGHLKIKDNTPQKIILSTDSFTQAENKWLINFLHDKYHLNFRLDKQNRIILYDQFQIHYFLYLITPYLHKSMHRKFISFSYLMRRLPTRRTTIYLPSTIEIQSPTKEINHFLYYLSNLIDLFKDGKLYSKLQSEIYQKYRLSKKSYQIVIPGKRLSKLEFLKVNTGLTFSQLTEICASNLKF